MCVCLAMATNCSAKSNCRPWPVCHAAAMSVYGPSVGEIWPRARGTSTVPVALRCGHTHKLCHINSAAKTVLQDPKYSRWVTVKTSWISLQYFHFFQLKRKYATELNNYLKVSNLEDYSCSTELVQNLWRLHLCSLDFEWGGAAADPNW